MTWMKFYYLKKILTNEVQDYAPLLSTAQNKKLLIDLCIISGN